MIHYLLRRGCSLRLSSLLLCTTLLLTAACGGRSIGTPDPDGGPPPPIDVEVQPQPDYDGWVVPNDPVGCWPTPWQVKIHNPGEPSFVHTLDRTTGNAYVLAASQGWSQTTASLQMLDGETLEQLSTISADAERVHARFDQWSGEVVALAESENEVRYQRYFIIASRFLELIDSVFLCDNCVAAWGGPETVEAFSASAVRDLTDNRLRVYVLPSDGSGDLFISEPVVGSSPRLSVRGERMSLLYVHDQQLWERRSDRYGDLTPPDQRSVTPIQGLLGAETYADNILVAAVLTANPSNPQLEIIKMTGSSSEEIVTLPAPLDYAVEGAVSFSPSTVALAWGDNVGDVGAHFLGARTQVFAPIYGPERISDYVDQSVSSYTIWAATAYHPRGHAVVWGGWHTDGQYGIYGKLVECRGGI